jgi:hypothetical protein
LLLLIYLTYTIGSGQTGAGKTYTLSELGSPEALGVLPRAVGDLFNLMESEKGRFEYTAKVSYIQIYSEIIYDLLQPENTNLQIREDKNKVYVDSLSQHRVRNLNDVVVLLDYGTRTKIVAASKLNRLPNRSHTIFTLSIKRRDKLSGKIFAGKFVCCDLAGSERINIKSTIAASEETKNVGKSLAALGNIISVLADENKSGKNSFIPWRDSKLTRILQDTIGGDSRVSLIVNLSPDSQNYNDSVNSVLFGQRAMSVALQPTVNETTVNYKKLAERLQKKLDELQNNTVSHLVQKNQTLVEEASNILKDLEGVTKSLEQMREEKDRYHAWYVEAGDKNIELIGDLQKANNTIKQLDKIVTLVTSSNLSGIDLSKISGMRNKILGSKPMNVDISQLSPIKTPKKDDEAVDASQIEARLHEVILLKQKRQNEMLRRQNELQIDALKKLVEEREMYKQKLETMTRQHEILSLQLKKMDENSNSINETVSEIKKQKRKQTKILNTYQKRMKELDTLNEILVTDLKQLDNVLCTLQKNSIITVTDDNDSILFALKDQPAPEKLKAESLQVSHLEQAIAQLLQQVIEREKIIELMIQQRKLFNLSTSGASSSDDSLFASTASASFQFGSIRNIGKFQRWDLIYRTLNELKQIVPANTPFGRVDSGKKHIKRLTTDDDDVSFIYLDGNTNVTKDPVIVDFDKDPDRFNQQEMIESEDEDSFSKELRLLNFKYQSLKEEIEQESQNREEVEDQNELLEEQTEDLENAIQVLNRQVNVYKEQEKLITKEKEKLQNYCDRLEERFTILQQANDSLLDDEDKYSYLVDQMEFINRSLSKELNTEIDLPQTNNVVDENTKHVENLVVSAPTLIEKLEQNIQILQKLAGEASNQINSAIIAHNVSKEDVATQSSVILELPEIESDSEDTLSPRIVKDQSLESKLREIREEKMRVRWNMENKLETENEDLNIEDIKEEVKEDEVVPPIVSEIPSPVVTEIPKEEEQIVEVELPMEKPVVAPLIPTLNLSSLSQDPQQTKTIKTPSPDIAATLITETHKIMTSSTTYSDFRQKTTVTNTTPPPKSTANLSSGIAETQVTDTNKTNGAIPPPRPTLNLSGIPVTPTFNNVAQTSKPSTPPRPIDQRDEPEKHLPKKEFTSPPVVPTLNLSTVNTPPKLSPFIRALDLSKVVHQERPPSEKIEKKSRSTNQSETPTSPGTPKTSDIRDTSSTSDINLSLRSPLRNIQDSPSSRNSPATSSESQVDDIKQWRKTQKGSTPVAKPSVVTNDLTSPSDSPRRKQDTPTKSSKSDLPPPAQITNFSVLFQNVDLIGSSSPSKSTEIIKPSNGGIKSLKKSSNYSPASSTSGTNL